MRKSAIVASGQAFAYGLALAASPILSRLYSPQDFGLMAIFVTLVSVLGTIATLRYDNAIPLPKDEHSAELLATLARRSVIITSGLLLIAAIAIGGTLNGAIFRSQDAPFSFLLAAAVATFASCEIHNASLVRQGQFTELSRMRVIYAVTCVATQLAIPIFWKAGPIGLLLGLIVGYAVESLVVVVTGRHSSLHAANADLRALGHIAAMYRNYPLFDVWASVLRVLAVHGQTLLIAWIYGPAAAGCLALAQRLLSTPASMLSFSLSRVYYSEAATLARDDPAELRRLFAKTFQRMALLAAPPLAVVCVLAPWSFGLVFGGQWKIAGAYCALLCPLILLRIISFVLGPTLDVVHRQGLRMLRELICVVLIAAGVGFAQWMDWSDLAAVALTSAFGCVGYALSIAVTWRALLAFGKHPAEQSDLSHHATAA
jgi:O-antigen/teichoic acid export membrane protein